ncbi:MAG: nicotinate (nicotinamide) nucleotide adenylyltransferase [Pseudohongiellaceae bacterium]
MSTPVAVLGGLFDPVHKGHVSAATFAVDFLPVQRLIMVPCRVPNHKAAPSTPARHRLAMLKIATAAYPQIEIDPIELIKDGVSYTVETLSELKRHHSTLVFVLGLDAFNALTEWHEWQRILELSHLLVLGRPGCVLSDDTAEKLGFEQRRVFNAEQLLESHAGKIICYEDFDFDIASSEIREKLLLGIDVSTELDPEVIKYIKDNGLYQKQ